MPFSLRKSGGRLRGRYLRVALLAAGAGLVGVAGLFTIMGQGENASEPPTLRREVPVQIEVVHPQTISRKLIVPGIVEPESRIELGFRVDGFILRFRLAGPPCSTSTATASSK